MREARQTEGPDTRTGSDDGFPGKSARFEEARDVLRRAAREAVPPFTAQWSAVDHGASEAMDVNSLLPLVGAWSTLDMPHAAGLVRSTLEACGPDGRLDRFLSPAHPAVLPPPAWPLVAVSARRLSGPAVEAERDDLLDLLRLYLGWAVSCFDPEGRAQPRWPDAESAFIPDTWDQDLLPVDLTVFLCAEFQAYDELQGLLGLDTGDDPRVPPGYRDALARHLRQYLWDPESGRFTDRYGSGPRIGRLTLSAATPLFIPHRLPPAQFAAARTLLSPQSPLLCEGRFSLWERWPDDPEPPPQPVLQQAILFEALTHPSLTPEREMIRRGLLSQHGTDPVNAAIFIRAHTTDRPNQADMEYPPWVRWLDRKTSPILWLLGSLLVLGALFILTMPRFFPRSGEGPSIEALAGLAQSHYTRGDYDQAGDVYTQILTRSNLPSIAYYLGNTRYRQERYAEAEALYRHAMNHADFQVRAGFNLAQVLIQQGDTTEAISLLQEIVSQHGRMHPEVAQRASIALEFLESVE